MLSDSREYFVAHVTWASFYVCAYDDCMHDGDESKVKYYSTYIVYMYNKKPLVKTKVAS